MCKSRRKNLVAGELTTRILIGIFNLYTIISNGTIMLTQNELQKYLIVSNLISGSFGLVLTYINESLKNQISNYDSEENNQGPRPRFGNRYAIRTSDENVTRKLNAWIPFMYSM
jgi:hypothetical protein